MQTATSSTQGWHVANWGLWGWLETIVKLIGAGAGIVAFFNTMSISTLTLGGSPRLAAVILLGLLTFISIGLVFVRIRQQEIVSIFYAIFNLLGHAGLLIALLRAPQQTTLGIVFGIAYVAGELIKQRFLVVSGFTEAGQTTQSMVNFSRGVALFYLLLLIFLVI